METKDCSLAILVIFLLIKKMSSLLLFVYITSALLCLQLPCEAREDASNIKMD